MQIWLFGIRSKHVRGNIFDINVNGYGSAEIGPYLELRNYIGVNSGLECHHIVAVEHLKLFSTPYAENNAPAIAIPAALHRQIVSPRITAEMNSFGGRSGGISNDITKEEILELYHQVYTWHTPFRELYQIAKNILR